MAKSNTNGVIARKHRKVLKKMSANVGKKDRNSISQAACDAGYSESYARSGRLQKTKSWQQLVDGIKGSSTFNLFVDICRGGENRTPVTGFGVLHHTTRPHPRIR